MPRIETQIVFLLLGDLGGLGLLAIQIRGSTAAAALASQVVNAHAIANASAATATPPMNDTNVIFRFVIAAR